MTARTAGATSAGAAPAGAVIGAVVTPFASAVPFAALAGLPPTGAPRSRRASIASAVAARTAGSRRLDRRMRNASDGAEVIRPSSLATATATWGEGSFQTRTS